MKIGLVLRELHRSENDLAHELLQASEHNKVDQEMYHLARDLAGWSQQHIPLIAEAARRYGEDLDAEPESELKIAERVREKTSDLIGHHGEASWLMLRDLRKIYTKASGCPPTGRCLRRRRRASSTPSCSRLPNSATRIPCARCVGPTASSRSRPPRCWSADGSTATAVRQIPCAQTPRNLPKQGKLHRP
jgi:hypothetical protein